MLIFEFVLARHDLEGGHEHFASANLNLPLQKLEHFFVKVKRLKSVLGSDDDIDLLTLLQD